VLAGGSKIAVPYPAMIARGARKIHRDPSS
jgi:hypothetical protein